MKGTKANTVKALKDVPLGRKPYPGEVDKYGRPYDDAMARPLTNGR